VDARGEKARRCKCAVVKKKQDNLNRLFAAAGIPKRFKDKPLNSFDAQYQKGAWMIACRYVERFREIRQEKKNGLCFIGPSGTGKSHLAYGILSGLLAQAVPGICGTVPDILDMLRPRQAEQANSQERLHALKSLDIVILDDLGAERETPWVTERLYVIINYRYNEILPTIITSNQELEDLEKLPGWGRIVSRLFEMCHLIRMDGRDYRKGESDAVSR